MRVCALLNITALQLRIEGDLGRNDASSKSRGKAGVVPAQEIRRAGLHFFRGPQRIKCSLQVRPLGDALKMRVDGSYKARDFFALATKLLVDPAFGGKLVVICWTYSELPALAGSLNVRSGDFPESWDELVFNQIFELNYTASGRPKVKKVAQPF